MKKIVSGFIATLVFSAATFSSTHADTRELVKLPDMMQEHMMANMRDHLAAINEILLYMANDELDKVADVAESRLGMSSLESHGASHMAGFMPEKMQKTGTQMHRAASRFAIAAQGRDLMEAYRALPDLTSSCVACHTDFRIR